jgi:hypothetical protein
MPPTEKDNTSKEVVHSEVEPKDKEEKDEKVVDDKVDLANDGTAAMTEDEKSLAKLGYVS